MTGVTKSGFKFAVDEGIADDYEFVELLCEIADGQFEKFPKFSKMVLGDEQVTALKDHLRENNGRCSTKAMIAEIFEIVGFSKDSKNC